MFGGDIAEGGREPLTVVISFHAGKQAVPGGVPGWIPGFVRERAELLARLEVCGLQMHPAKTQTVYCKGSRRLRAYSKSNWLPRISV